MNTATPPHDLIHVRYLAKIYLKQGNTPTFCYEVAKYYHKNYNYTRLLSRANYLYPYTRQICTTFQNISSKSS